jgi:hypothetical protein
MRSASLPLMVLIFLVSGFALIDGVSADIPTTKVCDLLNSPSKFAGCYRARSSTSMVELQPSLDHWDSNAHGTNCEWVPAGFVSHTYFIGATGFATFVGRLQLTPGLNFNSRFQKKSVEFVIV